jgi:hypothetical protein
MDPPGPFGQTGAVRFTSPGIVWDVLLLAVLLPIATFVVALMLMAPLSLVLAGSHLSDRTALAITGVPSVVLVTWLARRLLYWSVTLADDAILVGSWWPRRVAYEKIMHIALGRQYDVWTLGARRPHSGAEPLLFTTGRFSQHRIFLRPPDAERCFRELYARCPNAGAIDARANVLPPRNADAPPFAWFQLAEKLTIRSVVAFGAGLIFAAMGVMLIIAPATGDRWSNMWSRAAHAATLLTAGASCIGYGCHAFAQARKALRGGFKTGI